MTNRNKNSANIEENLYQILDVPNTASLADIRKAYEGKLEDAHLEAFAAYSLYPAYPVYAVCPVYPVYLVYPMYPVYPAYPVYPTVLK